MKKLEENFLITRGKKEEIRTGLVVKNLAGYYYVQIEERILVECRIRGKMKDNLLTGDWVEITLLKNNRGVIEKRLPRNNQMLRPRIANSSLVLLVVAANKPRPDLMMLDRFLLLVRYSGLKPCIVINKSDLPFSDSAEMIRSYYANRVAPLVLTAANESTGIEDLYRCIKGEIAVLSGPSGVGKTSLLNRLLPNRDEKTQAVSKKIGRGRHTTRHVELYSMPEGGYLADTPGFTVMDIPEMKREDLSLYYPDFMEYTHKCRFGNCLHYKEKECGVIEAVNDGKIILERYHNYILILEEIIKKERNY